MDVAGPAAPTRVMRCRGWWPAAGTANTEPAKHRERPFAEAACTVQSGKHTTIQDKQHINKHAIPDSPKQTVSSETLVLQSTTDNLDWQTLLLQKLLPKCNVAAAQTQLAAHSQSEAIISRATEPATEAHSQDSLPMLLQPPVPLSSPSFQYAGIFLDPLSAARLLSWAPPRHSKLSADHLTLLYRPSQEQMQSLTLGLQVDLPIVAKAHDLAIQVLSIGSFG